MTAIFIIVTSLIVAFANLKSEERAQEIFASTIYSNLNKNEEEIIEEKIILPENASLKNYLPLAIAPYFEEETEEELEVIEGRALIVPLPEIKEEKKKRDKIVVYEVKPGDTLGGIAEKFGISLKTILWENKLSPNSIIRVGQKLTILPVTGLTHKVKRGETLEKIAKKYKANVEEIVEFNKLVFKDNIAVGQLLIIPNGVMPPPPRPRIRPRLPFFKVEFDGRWRPAEEARKSRRFPWGQCTWYVAQRRYVPWGGHAKHWMKNARAYGYEIGKKPQVGAIISIRENWRYGHVGYVEEVTDRTVTFSEMNKFGVGVYSKRTFSIDDPRIIGYIY